MGFMISWILFITFFTLHSLICSWSNYSTIIYIILFVASSCYIFVNTILCFFYYLTFKHILFFFTFWMYYFYYTIIKISTFYYLFCPCLLITNMLNYSLFQLLCCRTYICFCCQITFYIINYCCIHLLFRYFFYLKLCLYINGRSIKNI